MPISIVCSQCKTPYTIPDHLAGKTVSCKHCSALLDVPLPAIAGGGGAFQPVFRSSMGTVSANTRYQRIVGKPTPVFLEILGIHMRWSEEFAARDIFLLLWSLRHIVLWALVIIFWITYAGNPDSAQMAAPFFFGAGAAMLLFSWLQVSRISRDITLSLGGGSGDSASILPHILSSFLLVVTDFRAAIPALRTLFLALLLLIASLSLAVESGNWEYILPINSLPSFTTESGRHPETAPAPPPAPAENPAASAEHPTTPPAEPVPAPPPAIPAPPTATQEAPIPPPDDAPVPPPPG